MNCDCSIQGSMNWTHIPSSETCFNITVSDKMKVYQFAISANSQSTLKADVTSPYQPISSSSGMVWVSCTVLQNKSKDISILNFITFGDFNIVFIT